MKYHPSIHGVEHVVPTRMTLDEDLAPEFWRVYVHCGSGWIYVVGDTRKEAVDETRRIYPHARWSPDAVIEAGRPAESG